MWNGHSRTLLTTMRIGTTSLALPHSLRFDDQEVGVVGQNTQQDGANDAVDADRVLVPSGERVLAERISDQDFACLPVVAAQHDEMTRRLSADIVGAPLGAVFAGIAVQI